MLEQAIGLGKAISVIMCILTYFSSSRGNSSRERRRDGEEHRQKR